MSLRQHGQALALVLTVTLIGRAGQQSDEAVTLRVANYQQLGDAIKQQRGKVVVIDFWADT